MEPDTIQVRPLGPAHASQVLGVIVRAIRATEGKQYTSSQVQAWLQGMHEDRMRAHLDSSEGLGAFEGDDLLGFASFVSADEALEFLYVDPGAWRRGVARRLVAGIEALARSQGASQVRVDASLLARPTLERLGYTVVETYRKHANGESFDNAWLSKKL